MIFAPNQILLGGKYVIEAFIGKGGMAEVWRARNKQDDSVIAIKILKPKALAQKTMAERFELEYEILKKLDHPNIIRVHDYSTFKYHDFDLPWFSMDYYEQSFYARLHQITPGEGIRLLFQILDGLQYAHEQNICHRDLKAENILVGENDQLALTDFGIAKDLESDRNLTEQRVIGTPHYLSPEQCRGLQVTTRSDIYTMGIILYRLATRRFPFNSNDAVEVIHMHVMREPRAVRDIEPEISVELNDAIMRCLNKKPEDRFESARELKVALAACPELKEGSGQKRVLDRNGFILADKNEYRALGLIRQLAGSEVYRVQETTSQKVYALKILRPKSLFDPRNLERFQKEVDILRSLDHKKIVRIVDTGKFVIKTDELPFCVMDYYPGNLQSSLVDPVDPNKALPIILDVLDALAYVHERNPKIVHGNIKPSNILIQSAGRGSLTDFGADLKLKEDAGPIAANPTLSQTNIRTRTYMSPEQIMGRELDARSDLYSVGVILYSLAAGRLPFKGRTEAETSAMHLRDVPPPPSEFNPNISGKLDAIILKTLAKAPGDRYQSARELINALRDAYVDNRWVSDKPFEVREDERSALSVLFGSAATYMAAAGAILFCFAFLLVSGRGRSAERAERMAAAMSAMSADAPPPPVPGIPVGLLVREDREELNRLDYVRGIAVKESDIAMAMRIDARTRDLLDRAEKPVIRLSRDTRRLVQNHEIRTKARSESVPLALEPSTADLDLVYTYKVTDGTREAASGESDSPSFTIPDLPSNRTYKFELAAVWRDPDTGKEFRPEFEEYPDGFEIRIVESTKNVRVSFEAAGSGRWSLANAAEEGFARCQWFVRSDGGEEVSVGTSEAGALPAVTLRDVYRTPGLSDGAYRLICRAYDSGDGALHYDSVPEEIIIDNQPPEVRTAGDVQAVVMLPNESRSVSVTATDNMADPASLRIEASTPEGETLTPADGSLRLTWVEPAEGEVLRTDSVMLIVSEPAGHGMSLSSAPVMIDRVSLSAAPAETFERLRKQDEELAAAPELHARTLRISSPAMERLLDGAGAFDTDWLSRNIGRGAGLFTEMENFRALRRELMTRDEKFDSRMKLFRRFASAASGQGRIDVAALDRKAADWGANTDAALDPDNFLADLRDSILPQPPEDSEAVVRITEPGGRLPEIRLRGELAAEYGGDVMYRFTQLLTARPEVAAGALRDWLGEHPTRTIGRDDVLLPQREGDYTAPLYLALQLYMEDQEGGFPLVSEPRVYEIPVLIPVRDDFRVAVTTYQDTLARIAEEGETGLPATSAWLAATPDPISGETAPLNPETGSVRDAGARHVDAIWRQVFQNNADDEKQAGFVRWVDSLGERIESDREFVSVRDNVILGATAAWKSAHRDALAREVAAAWIKAPGGAAAEEVIRASIADYRSAHADELLEPPVVRIDPGRPETINAAGPVIVPRGIAGSVSPDRLRFAWAESGSVPSPSDAGWAGTADATRISLRELPAKDRTWTLAMRIEEEDSGSPIRSEWVSTGFSRIWADDPPPVPVSDPGTAPVTNPATSPGTSPSAAVAGGPVTQAEAQAFAATIQGALPRKGTKYDSAGEMLGGYMALFDPPISDIEKVSEDISGFLTIFQGRQGATAVSSFNDTRRQYGFGAVRWVGAKSAEQHEYEIVRIFDRGAAPLRYVITLKRVGGELRIVRDEKAKK